MKARILLAAVAVVGLAFLVSFTVSAKPPVSNIKMALITDCSAMKDACKKVDCLEERQKIEEAIAARFEAALNECTAEFGAPSGEYGMAAVEQCKYLDQYQKAAMQTATIVLPGSIQAAAADCLSEQQREKQSNIEKFNTR